MVNWKQENVFQPRPTVVTRPDVMSARACVCIPGRCLKNFPKWGESFFRCHSHTLKWRCFFRLLMVVVAQLWLQVFPVEEVVKTSSKRMTVDRPLPIAPWPTALWEFESRGGVGQDMNNKQHDANHGVPNFKTYPHDIYIYILYIYIYYIYIYKYMCIQMCTIYSIRMYT